MSERQSAESVPIEVNRRALPDRLRYFAKKLDDEGDQEVIRYAVASGLLAVAVELELHTDGGGADD